jgi:hypothetical protein
VSTNAGKNIDPIQQIHLRQQIAAIEQTRKKIANDENISAIETHAKSPV